MPPSTPRIDNLKVRGAGRSWSIFPEVSQGLSLGSYIPHPSSLEQKCSVEVGSYQHLVTLSLNELSQQLQLSQCAWLLRTCLLQLWHLLLVI